MSSRDIVSRWARRPRRAFLVLGSTALLCSLQLGLGVVAAGCGDSTAGQRITLQTRITAGKEVTAAFDNSYGWSITLTRAYLSVGELYYFNGPPVVAQWSPRPRGGARGFLGIPSALAHPGHYTEGDAFGQMLTPDTIDLMKETNLPDGEGVTGTYRSARFEYSSPPAGDLAGKLEGNVALVEGEAKKGTAVRLFRIAAVQKDTVNADGNPYVEGCVFGEVDVPADGTVLVTVKPSVWLDQVDFAAVPESTDGKPVEVVTGEIAHKAFARGLQKGTAYGFSYEEAAQ